MNNATKRGLGILGCSLLIGVVGDQLLRVTPYGLNLMLWVIFLTTTGAVFAWGRKLPIARNGRWLIVPMVVFAACFAWRDSPTLHMLDVLALCATLALAPVHGRGMSIRTSGIGDYLAAARIAVVNALVGCAALVTQHIAWNTVPYRGQSRQAQAAWRGLLVAVPLIITFGCLFASADAVFQKFAANLFHFDIAAILSHLWLTAALTWIVAGYLWCALIVPDKSESDALIKPAVTSLRLQGGVLGAIETSIILVSLNALFALFVLIQIRYFFGGAALVQATTGLTYTEYARRGFFELVTVAMLVLPMLLAIHWMQRRETPADTRLFGGLSSTLIALLFVIMASAVQRMRLYQETCGMTELRFYTMAFMAWLAVVFVWFMGTVPRGRRERFAYGALVTGLISVVVLHACNPDALIVRANVGHEARGWWFFTDYAANLSADAVPELVAALPKLYPDHRQAIAAGLNERYAKMHDSADWRSLTWGKIAAEQILARDLPTIQAAQAGT